MLLNVFETSKDSADFVIDCDVHFKQMYIFTMYLSDISNAMPVLLFNIFSHPKIMILA